MKRNGDPQFPFDLGEAFKRNLNFQYRGMERTYAEALSLALAHSFMNARRPAQDVRDAITSELLRSGWDTNIAGAASQAIFQATLQNDYSSILPDLEIAVRNGSSAALVALGVTYGSGASGQGPASKIVAHNFEAAAQSSDPAAYFNLGVFYYFGIGIPQDRELGAQYFKRAATLGDADAQYNLAIHYLGAKTDPTDCAAVLQYLRHATSQNHAGAQLCSAKIPYDRSGCS